MFNFFLHVNKVYHLYNFHSSCLDLKIQLRRRGWQNEFGMFKYRGCQLLAGHTTSVLCRIKVVGLFWKNCQVKILICRGEAWFFASSFHRTETVYSLGICSNWTETYSFVKTIKLSPRFDTLWFFRNWSIMGELKNYLFTSESLFFFFFEINETTSDESIIKEKG